MELTVYSRGPVIRAEAAAGDAYAALDMAVAKLEERLRRAADRRHARQHGHVHGDGAAANTGKLHGVRGLPAGVAEPELLPASLTAAAPLDDVVVATPEKGAEGLPDTDPDADTDPDVVLAAGPLVVRQKMHEAPPMSLDEALHHMELVGHDFFLYCDSACGLPSVVYRRRGYTYGVLRLQTAVVPVQAGALADAGERLPG